MTVESYREQFRDALLKMNQEAARELLMQTAEVLTPVQRLESLIIPALIDIGDQWGCGNAALSQLYMSGRICETLIDELIPILEVRRRDLPRTAVVVLGDFHVLGKRIVCSLLRSSGVDILDYGTAEVDETLTRIQEDGVKILLVSTLMLHSALKVIELRTKRDAAGLDFKIVVGGAPFRMDEMLWHEIGADAMGQSASDALGIIENLAKEME
ncbi:MAG: cobalamin-binding protein [Verrucomicrobia bacterium]|jgi:methanogenic corrinoid protein MtbC1|nr:cobalamin-binding protein [Verrucomicrobiota bacterium]MBT7067680.1 cobalamin-binding protein [Verrucomicrobiota bacterium]MBT7699781.1 cobalamin-binding protein [Verrucomicrobiota bacterium]